MKNLSAELFKKFKTLVVVLSGIAILSSCLKTYVDPRISTSAHTVFVNTVPDALQYTFYLDNFRVSNQAISFTYALPFIYVTAGSKKIDLIVRNTTTSVASDTILFKSTNYYVVFATGKEKLEFVVLEDAPANLLSPPTGKAKVRLLNLSPDSPNIDLVVSGAGGATLFTNLSYKSNTDFIIMDPGAYDLDFRETGTTVVKYTKHVNIEPNKLHNLFVIGAWNALSGEAGVDLGLMDATR